MKAFLNAVIGSVTEIKQKEGKKPFFVISAADVEVLPDAPDNRKWVSVFVRGESIEKLAPLHKAMSGNIGHYFSADGNASADVNVYEQKVNAQQTLSVYTSGITLMGKPLGTGKPAEAAEPALETANAGGAQPPEGDVGF